MLLPIRDTNPRCRFPVATYGIMLITAYFFGRQLIIGLQLSAWQNGVIPWEFTHLSRLAVRDRYSPLSTLILSMAHHGGLLHFLGNMLYLWIFGNNVEYELGHIRFLILYFFAGIAGMIAHIMTNPQSTVPAIGASGAIAGILGAYILLFPRARIRSVLFLIIIFQIVELPAVIVVGLWAVLQVFDAISLAGANMGVAVFAHLGGFVFGCAFIELFKGRRL